MSDHRARKSGSILDGISGAQDLRQLNDVGPPRVARAEPFNAAASTDTHLGAGWCVVEPTVALHEVFNEALGKTGRETVTMVQGGREMFAMTCFGWAHAPPARGMALWISH